MIRWTVYLVVFSEVLDEVSEEDESDSSEDEACCKALIRRSSLDLSRLVWISLHCLRMLMIRSSFSFRP